MKVAKKTMLAAALTLSIAGASTAAEAPVRKGWQDTGEFSFVNTAGNSRSSSLGFKDKLWRTWESSGLEFNVGGVRVESTTFNRQAIGTTSDYRIDNNSQSMRSAENYYLNGRYDRKITKEFFWFAGAGWERNRPSGIDNRYTANAGVGNIWADTEKVKFRTDYSLSYTKENDVVVNPDVDSKFLGARFSWAYLHKFGAATTYTNDFLVDENLKTTSDWRWTMTNAVAVNMSTHLALKAGVRYDYDHKPALLSIPLKGTNSVVTTPADKYDRQITTSLVVSF
jgi:putative salt-induced outer membrane protein YdiY